MDSKAATVKAFQRYFDILESLGSLPICQTERPTLNDHLMWMCDHMIKSENYPIDKMSRWLGYVQGCLVMKYIIDVETERNITREWFTTRETETHLPASL